MYDGTFMGNVMRFVNHSCRCVQYAVYRYLGVCVCVCVCAWVRVRARCICVQCEASWAPDSGACHPDVAECALLWLGGACGRVPAAAAAATRHPSQTPRPPPSAPPGLDPAARRACCACRPLHGRPNCVARTVQFEGRRRIFLFSDGPLAPGTELSYDYKLTCDLLLDKCKVGGWVGFASDYSAWSLHARQAARPCRGCRYCASAPEQGVWELAGVGTMGQWAL